MISRIFFLLKYFCFWLIVFILQKLIFLFYNHYESFSLAFKDWILILLNGLKLDLSMASYLLIIPVLLVFIGNKILNDKVVRFVLNIYSSIFLFILLYLGVVDMALYSYWGFKLDITPLLYIKTPGDALASVSIFEIFYLHAMFMALFLLLYFFYRKFFQYQPVSKNVKWYVTYPGAAFILAFLFLIARGGTGVSAMNLSRVYFHKERFANHSAINVFWNTIYSFIEREKLQRCFEYMDMQKAQEFYNQYSLKNRKDHEKFIKPGSNVLIIILESFSNKVISRLGGENGITPCLDTIFEKSIVFSDFYASGDRSDKGLVSIFSGYPAQPTTSIIDYPSKSQKLPFLYDNFSRKGYATAFYYGGDLNFANFKSYFSHPSIDLLVSVEDFDRKYVTQKWGVPDEYLFEKLNSDLDTLTQPFFYSCFTLSSHEPFDVPMDPKFGTKNRDQLSKNGFYYTDSVLNKFLNQAEKSEWWENTLIIITADHGSRSPGNTPNHSREKFQIPMIWTGGAILKNDTIILKTGSQTDIPATLLAQFGHDYSDFNYSFDMLNPENEGQAFYAFNNGFGFINHSDYVIFDNDFKKCISASGSDMDHSLEVGKAFLQIVSADFISR